MSLFGILFQSQLERTISAGIARTLEEQADNALRRFRRQAELEAETLSLKEAVENLKAEKRGIEEGFSRERREIEHMLGLERKRQAFETEQAKRETSVSLREEALKADRSRFEEQMKFHEDRFVQEVGYLKELLQQALQALPTASMVTQRVVVEKTDG